MDIALLSMALSQSQVKQQVNVSVMKNVMDSAEQNADFLNKMLADSQAQQVQHMAQPHLGGAIDLRL